MEMLANIVGNIGVMCFLGAYFLLQKGRVSHTSAPYLYLNLAGALLVLFSLTINWNLPAFLLEAAWALISMYGIYKHLYARKGETPSHDRKQP
jgi:hypothetical protein